jgi:dihydroorotase
MTPAHGPHPTVVIRDGRAVCGETGLDAITDIVVVDGKIAALGPQATGPRASIPPDAVVIDAHGAWVLPGMIDLGVHVREPGREHDEDLRTTLQLALQGGVTTLVALPDTTPAVDGADDVLHRRAAWAMARATEELRATAPHDASTRGPGARRVTDVVAPTLVVAGALTRRREGKEPADASDMASVGVDVFSDAAFIDDGEVLRRSLEYARGAGGKLAILHGPDGALSRGGVIVEGEVATRLGLAGIPELADALAAFRHIELAALAGISVHLGALFSAAALDVLERARGARASTPLRTVTAEVHPWHLLLDERAHLERRYDTMLRLDPPLPTVASRERLLAAVKAGTLSVSSGHRPVPNRTKDLEMAIAEPGASALSLTLPLLCGVLSPLELARATSALPARILGLHDRGRLVAGARADLVLLRPSAMVQGGELVDAAMCGGMAPANPWLGRRTAGRIDITLVGGRVAWQRAPSDEESAR